MGPGHNFFHFSLPQHQSSQTNSDLHMCDVHSKCCSCGGGGHGKTHGAVISSWNEFAPKLQACPGHRAPRALGTPCFFRFSQPPATTSLHHMVCRLCTCPVACGLSDSGNDVFFLPFHHPHHMCPTSWWDGATKHSAFHHHHFVKELS